MWTGDRHSLCGVAGGWLKEAGETCKTTTLFPGFNSESSISLTNKFVHISRNESSSFPSRMDTVSPNQTSSSPESWSVISDWVMILADIYLTGVSLINKTFQCAVTTPKLKRLRHNSPVWSWVCWLESTVSGGFMETPQCLRNPEGIELWENEGVLVEDCSDCLGIATFLPRVPHF